MKIYQPSITGSLTHHGSSVITGSVYVTNGITGSLLGTSSISINSITASYAPDYVLTAVTSSMLQQYVLNSLTGSFVQSNQTSSFITNSQTSSISVLSSSYSFTSSYALFSDNAITAFTASSINLGGGISGGTSYWIPIMNSGQGTQPLYSDGNSNLKYNDLTKTLTITSSWSNYSVTASYVLNNPGRAPGGIDGQLQYKSGSNFYGTQTLNYDPLTTLIVATNINATGSFSGSFIGNLKGTADFAQNSDESSVANLAYYANEAGTASYAPDYVLNSATSSYITNSQTSSFITNNQTSSFVINSQTSSFVTNSQTSSFVLNSQTSSFVINSQTSSMSVGSASYTPNAIVTASVSSNTITFTKGNNSQFSLTVNTGSAGSSTLPGGIDTQIQFNSGSTFSGSSNFVYDYILNNFLHGNGNTATSQHCHVEGYSTQANNGYYAHAEGDLTTANGYASHAEGYGSQAIGQYSHAEGNYSVAHGIASHAEGSGAVSSGSQSHAEGSNTKTYADLSHAEGIITSAGTRGYNCSVSSGIITLDSAYGDVSTVFSADSYIILSDSNLSDTIYTNKLDIDFGTPPYFDSTNTIITLLNTDISTGTAKVGSQTNPSSGDMSIGDASHAEGYSNKTYGIYSHAEGSSTYAIGDYSHTEGYNTFANSRFSHAEGNATYTYGESSHAEGYNTYAYGTYSHTEGESTYAYGLSSHAEGNSSIAYGNYSHASGYGTIASGSGQSVVGKFNKRNNTDDLFVIGNGTGNLDANRSDIFNVSSTTVTISGSVNISSSLTLTGTNTINGSLVFDSPVANNFNGEIVKFGSGTLTAGRLYFLSSSGTWSLANANSSGSSTGMLGIAVGSSPTTNGLLIRGYANSGSFTQATGSILYMATGSGLFTANAPTSSGHIVRVIGYKTTISNTIYFMPDNTWITLA